MTGWAFFVFCFLMLINNRFSKHWLSQLHICNLETRLDVNSSPQNLIQSQKYHYPESIEIHMCVHMKKEGTK